MLAGASCWVLYVDVLVLEMGGKDDFFAFDSLCPCLIVKREEWIRIVHEKIVSRKRPPLSS